MAHPLSVDKHTYVRAEVRERSRVRVTDMHAASEVCDEEGLRKATRKGTLHEATRKGTLHETTREGTLREGSQRGTQAGEHAESHGRWNEGEAMAAHDAARLVRVRGLS